MLRRLCMLRQTRQVRGSGLQKYKYKSKSLNQSKEERENLRTDGSGVDRLMHVGLKNNWVGILKHTGIIVVKNRHK